VLPLSVRGTAMGVAVFGNWAANFAVSQTFPPLVKALGPGTAFLGYAALGQPSWTDGLSCAGSG
jgi:hypothetical protein